MRRPTTLAIVLVLASAALSACGGTPATGPKMIVLGFDGMDYGLTKELMEEGRMPNFSRLEAMGGFSPLETAVPPQSPVAWSNFITGMDSGGHGIYDFLHRDPETIEPYLSTSAVGEGGMMLELGKYQFPLTGGSTELLRRGRAFWEVLEDHGVETSVIRMPANFPPTGTATRELSGMGTPDIQGGYGWYSFYTSKLFAFAGKEMRGDVHEVDIFDGVVETSLLGPENPLLREPEKLSSPFTVYLDPVDPVVKIVAGTEEVFLREGEWSDWVPVEFEMIPTQVLPAMVRFYLRSVRPDFELYATPANYDPLNLALPISTPDDYAEELAEATGRFYTQGMPEDTNAVLDGALTTEEFVEQAGIAGREIRDQYNYVLDQFQSGLLFYYFGNVDQISHVMWKVRDPEHPAYDPEEAARYAGIIEDLYVAMDDVVGQTLDTMDDDTMLVVMSDHGFTSYRRSFHLNAWLAQRGYLKMKNPDLKNDPGVFVNVDWTGTRAYGVGINALYLNLKGREKNGIVDPSERQALLDEIQNALLAEIDPKTGDPAITKVYQRDEVYKDRGELELGPDLIIGYAKMTRGDGGSATGKVGKEILTDNLHDWSGDHEMDHETVPGILLTSRPLKRPAASLKDLGQSILTEFDIDEPIQPPKPTSE